MAFEVRFTETGSKKSCKTLSYPNSNGMSVTDMLKTFQEEANKYLTLCIDGTDCLPAEGIDICIKFGVCCNFDCFFSRTDEDEMNCDSEEDETNSSERPNKLIKMS